MAANTTHAAVAVIGAGYWGKNLVRNFHQLGALACVCDARHDVLGAEAADYKVKTTSDYQEVLKDPSLRAVVIAYAVFVAAWLLRAG